MSKQTSIEWYDNQLKEIDFKLQAALITNEQCRLLMSEVFEQAKEMERQQIIDAWDVGNYTEPKETPTFYAEQYYKETYKK